MNGFSGTAKERNQIRFRLTDPAVKDRRTLEAIYDLAIKYRLASLGVAEDVHEQDDDDMETPSVSHDLKIRLESSVAPILA